MIDKIVFAECIPLNYTGKYINYNGQKIPNSTAEYCSIFRTLEDNQNKWLNDFDFWYKNMYNILKSKSKYFSFSNLSRSTIWYPVNLDPLFFSLALLEFNKNISEKILVINAPKQVKHLIETEHPKYFNFYLEFYLKKFIFIIISIVRIFNYFIKLLFNFNFSKSKFTTKDIVFSYLLNTNNDHFFGNIFQENNVFATYVNYSDKYFFKIKNKRTLTIFNFLKIQDIFFCIKEAFTLFVLSLNIKIDTALEFSNLKINNTYFSHYFLTNTIFSYTPLSEFVVYRCFKNIVTEFDISKIIYPYEEKGAEHALLLAVQNYNQSVRTIAFTHANYNNGHRYMKYNCKLNLYPNYLATTGIIQQKWLNEVCNWPNERLFLFGSPRYSSNKISIKIKGKKSIIFLVGYIHELIQFSVFLKDSSKIFSNLDIHIRIYPHAYLEEQIKIINSLNEIGIKVTCNQHISLSENLNLVDFVIFSSSSAGIESIMNNCYAIYYPMNLNIITNPLSNKEGSNIIPTVDSPDKFNNLLNNLLNLSESELIFKKQEQVAFVNKMYSKVSFNYYNQIT